MNSRCPVHAYTASARAPSGEDGSFVQWFVAGSKSALSSKRRTGNLLSPPQTIMRLPVHTETTPSWRVAIGAAGRALHRYELNWAAATWPGGMGAWGRGSAAAGRPDGPDDPPRSFATRTTASTP